MVNETKEGYLLDTNIASLAFDAGRDRHTMSLFTQLTQVVFKQIDHPGHRH